VSSRVVTDRSRIDIFLQLSMTPEGAQIWRRMTSANINRCIAIVVDGKVVSYPRVQSEVTGGNTEITGSFTLSEAQALAAILSSGGGKLPLSLKIAELKTEKTE
jgi:SecD/SecF fusion protein